MDKLFRLLVICCIFALLTPPTPRLFAGQPLDTQIRPQSAPRALPDGWQERTLVTRGDAGASQDLAMDGADRPHILHIQTAESTALLHTWYDGVTWRDELVVDFAPNQYTAIRPLRLAAAGDVLAAAWQDPVTNRVAVAVRQNDGAWAVQPEPPLGRNFSFSLGIWNGRPAFAWYDSAGQDLLFGWLDQNSQWQWETADGALNAGEYSSMAISPDGIVHVAYFEREQLDLRYARREVNGTWNSVTLHTFGNAGLTTAIALDGNGFPHIAHAVFTPSGTADLYYVYQDATGWSSSLPVALGTVGGALDIDVDANGTTRILFSRYGQRAGAYLLEQNAATWDETPLGLQLPVNMGVDADGHPHLIHYDGRYRDLKYAYRGSEWETVSVVPQISGNPFGAAQDASGTPRFSLNWNGLEAVGWQDGAWARESITDTNTARHSSLAYDVEGFAHVAYYSQPDGDLIYGRQSEGQWRFTTVDSAGDVGSYPKLLVRNNLNPVIVYWDASNFRLKVAEFVGGQWRISTQPPGVALNADSSRFDATGFAPDGSLFITYYDAAATDLRLARVSRIFSEWTWTDSLIGSEDGETGFVSAATMGGSGAYLAVAFSHVGTNGNGALRYGYLPTAGNNPRWTIGQLALEHMFLKRVVGIDVALKNGSHHMPRIAYITRSTSGDHEAWLTSKDGELINWRHEQMDDNVNPLSDRVLSPVVFVDPVDRVAWNDLNDLYLRSRLSDEDHPGTVASNAQVAASISPNNGGLSLLCVCLMQQTCLGVELDHFNPTRAVTFAAATAAQRPLEERLHEQFVATTEGNRYVELYRTHGQEMYDRFAADPALMRDAYRALENYTPALILLAAGRGEEIVLDSGMIDTALDIWQRLAAAGSPELAGAINAELATTNNLADFTNKTVAESAEVIGVDPAALVRMMLYLPFTEK